MSFLIIAYNDTKMRRKSKIMLHAYRGFIVYIKTQEKYVDIAKDVETRFDTSNYELEKPLPRGKIKR